MTNLHQRLPAKEYVTAKSEPWLSVKRHYDMGGGQDVPFLASLVGGTEAELCAQNDAGANDWQCRIGWLGRGHLITQPLMLSWRGVKEV